MARRKDPRKERIRKERKRQKAAKEKARLRRSRPESRSPERSWKDNIEAHERFLKECISTEAGRQADELWGQASALLGAGEHARALRVLANAQSLFPSSDRSAAASVLHHNLAYTHEHLGFGYRSINIQHAIRYYRLALESPARRRSPIHRLLTMNALGSALRQMAEAGSELETLDQAEAQLAETIEVRDRAGMLPPETHLSPELNLSNVHRTRFVLTGDEDTLVAAERRLRALLQHPMIKARLPTGFPWGPEKIEERAVVALAWVLLRSGGDRRTREARQLIRSLIESRDDQQASQIQLDWAKQLLHTEDDLLRSEAKSILESLALSRLDVNGMEALGDLARKVDLDDLAVAAYQGASQALFMERYQSARGDIEADTLSLRAQNTAIRCAEMLVRQGTPLDALVLLEQTAAPRFEEAYVQWVWRPHDAETMALETLRNLYGASSIGLADLGTQVSAVASFEPDQRAIRFALETATQAIEDEIAMAGDPDPHATEVQTELLSALREATDRADAGAFIREYGERLVDRYEVAEQLIRARDASFQDRREAPFTTIDPLSFKALAAAHPDRAFVRIDAADGHAAAVSAWHDGELRIQGVQLDAERIARIADSVRARVAPEPEDLAAVDLGELFPGDVPRRLVILAGRDAALLPPAALRAGNELLVHRFAEIVCLPCIAPLRQTMQVYEDRTGTAFVVPGTTRFHDVALSSRNTDRSLTREEATIDAVRATCKTASAVSFYAHGSVPRERAFGNPATWSPGTSVGELDLADGPCAVEVLAAQAAGCERIELWACETGRNVEEQFLTPQGLAEAFGMDVAFLKGGAQTTVGTLWPVPDLPTSCICAIFQHEVELGVAPATALLDAQRWWIDTAVPSLRQLKDSETATAATVLAVLLDQLEGTVGHPIPRPESTDTRPLLAPGGFADHEGRETLDLLMSPVSWAGFRFMGEHGNAERIGARPEPTREIIDEAKRQIDEVIRGGPRAGQTVDQAVSHYTREAVARWERADHDGDNDGVVQAAIDVARQMRQRPCDSFRLNTFRGLAYVYESIRRLKKKEAGQDGLHRLHRLQVEAFLCWAELAFEETLAGHADISFLRSAARQRCRDLLAEVPAGHPMAPLCRLAHAMVCEYGVADPVGNLRWQSYWGEAPKELEPYTNACLVAARGIVETHARIEHAIWLIRATCGGAGTLDPSLSDRVQRHGRDVASDVGQLDAGIPNIRLDMWLEEAEHSMSPGGVSPTRRMRHAPSAVPGIERLILVRRATMTASRIGRSSERETLQYVSKALSAWELELWGEPVPTELNETLARFGTGPDLSYAAAVDLYLAGSVLGNPTNGATDVLTGLEYLAGRRVEYLHRLHRLDIPTPFTGWMEGATRLSWLAERNMAAAFVSSDPDRSDLPRLDPFELSSEEYLGELRGSEDSLILGLDQASAGGNELATVAWQATRSFEQAEAALADMCTHVPEGTAPALARALGSGTRWDELVARHKHPPAQTARLGLRLGERGELLVAAAWTDSKGRSSSQSRAYPLRGRVVAEMLVGANLSLATDNLRGAIPGTDRSWLDAVIEAMEEPLRDVLGPAIADGANHLEILAPGMLRALPLAPLQIGSGARDRLVWLFDSLCHVTTWNLAHEGPSAPGNLGGCWVPDPGQIGPWSTGFHERVLVDQLSFSDLPAGHLSDDTIPGLVVLGDAGDSKNCGLAPELGLLVVLGEGNGTLSPVTSGIMAGGRSVPAANLLVRSLPRLRAVHLWASTETGREPAEYGVPGDLLPGVVGPLIAAGAQGVLHESWPLPDLAKALLAEFVVRGSLRFHGGPEALIGAQRWWLDRVAPSLSGGTPGGLTQAAEAVRRGSYGAEATTSLVAECVDSPGPDLHGLDPADPLLWGTVIWYGV